MSANSVVTENMLADWAVVWLRERLPGSWRVELSAPDRGADGDARSDAVIRVDALNVHATILLQAKRSLAPRGVDRLLGGVGRSLRAHNRGLAILVVAPWLSPRTRELLRAEDINYIDQTGNASVRLDNPAVFIETEGANRDPSPALRAPPRIRGPKAARLIRTLLDVRPPYGVRELADAASLAPGYVSRLLDALDEDAVIARARRGRVEHVDVAALVGRWAETYDVFGTNDVAAYLAPRGAAQSLAQIASAGSGRTAITGSFAAVRRAPVTAPALLAVYCDDVDAVAAAADLLPADQGSNVVLLRPFDPVVWDGTEEEEGVRYVAPSQAAVDCLTGNGRMPAEGEALVSWMVENEAAWRRDGLAPAPA